MAKKTLGYEELQWTCPNCTGSNPGMVKTCGQCGAPQPEDVKFEQVSNAKLRQDDEIEKHAKAGPDIHCPYCGTRNAGNAAACVQCGGDLVGGEQRQSGQVLGAYRPPSDAPVKKVKCPNCGTENPETDKTCAQCGANLATPAPVGQAAPPRQDLPEPSRPVQPQKSLPVALVIAIVVLCCVIGGALIYFLFLRTEATTGTVQNVGWERTIAIEGLGPVEHEDWRSEIPADGNLGSCESKIRFTSDQPQANSEEVCGTPYSVDTGSGVAEVVQDCEYQVYAEYCAYTLMEWTVVDTVSLSGNGFTPQWPQPTLTNDQRLGAETESYTVYFETANGSQTYSTQNFGEFQQYQIGTTWTLEVNTLGGVQSVRP